MNEMEQNKAAADFIREFLTVLEDAAARACGDCRNLNPMTDQIVDRYTEASVLAGMLREKMGMEEFRPL